MVVKAKDKTASIIEAILKENTGMSILDSGGAYGRNYERNQKRNFTKENACQVDISTWQDNEGKDQHELNISFNLYHYLNAYLDYDDMSSKLEDDFNKFADLSENEDKAWLTIMEEFADKYTNFGTTNTYNFDNILSQVIQYTAFSLTNDEYDIYILLQIHGGCDVRGGYTKPRILKVLDRDYFILAQNDCDAMCNNCGAHWYSDDGGYHWYIDYGGIIPQPKHQRLLPNTPKQQLVEKPLDKATMTKDGVLCPICNHKLSFGVSEGF